MGFWVGFTGRRHRSEWSSGDVVLSRRHRSGGRSERMGDLFAVISLKLIIGLNYVFL